MSHLSHISKNKKNLDTRWIILKAIREFFWADGFVEVESPIILRLPGQEPYLSPVKTEINDENGKQYLGFLHTSPEYTMKKMLSAGYEKIFSLGKCFRNYESFGGTHNTEFTMIEWYRAHSDFWKLMDDVENLLKFVAEELLKKGYNLDHVNYKNFERLHMRDAWKEFAGVNFDEYLAREKMFELCVAKGYKPDKNEAYEDLFFRIFLNEIEPKLGRDNPVCLHHYPIQMAALSKASKTDAGYAERVEVYLGGMELANGFSELIDADEQLKRLKEDRKLRKKLGRDDIGVDLDFIEALRAGMPESAGIALGVDRLVMAFAGCKNIDDVITLPASKLFNN